MRSTRRHAAATLAALGTLGLAARTQAQPRPSSAAEAAKALLPTPSQMTGPYYPVVPIPLRSALLGAGGRGEPLGLVGRVLNAQGQAQKDIRVEIWQADARGIYRHPAQHGHELVDPAFASFGAVLTDAEGRYAFDTIVPVPYEGRPPHIHARLHRAGQVLLTTQLYLRGRAQERGMAAMWGGDRERISLDLIPPEGAGARRASFDFVI